MSFLKHLLCVALLAFGLPRPTIAQEVVRVGGTGLGSLLLQKIADQEDVGGYRIQVMMPPLGSAGGLRALAANAIDVAIVTIPPANPTATSNDSTYRVIPWLKTPFVFTGRDVSDSFKLDFHQIAAIYAGRMTVWPDGKPVRLVTRSERESDTRLLREFSKDLDLALSEAIKRTGMPFAENDLENQQQLERISGSFGAIGLGQLRLTGSQLKALSFDGVTPSADTLDKGNYRLAKPFFLVISKTPPPSLLRFIAHLQSPEVIRKVRKYEFSPLAR